MYVSYFTWDDVSWLNKHADVIRWYLACVYPTAIQNVELKKNRSLELLKLCMQTMLTEQRPAFSS